MKYHLHLVDTDDRYTDYTCGGLDITPDMMILYEEDPIENPKAKLQKLVSLKSFKYVDIDEIGEEH